MVDVTKVSGEVTAAVEAAKTDTAAVTATVTTNATKAYGVFARVSDFVATHPRTAVIVGIVLTVVTVLAVL